MPALTMPKCTAPCGRDRPGSARSLRRAARARRARPRAAFAADPRGPPVAAELRSLRRFRMLSTRLAPGPALACLGVGLWVGTRRPVRRWPGRRAPAATSQRRARASLLPAKTRFLGARGRLSDGAPPFPTLRLKCWHRRGSRFARNKRRAVLRGHRHGVPCAPPRPSR